jgi:hypothetical protein
MILEGFFLVEELHVYNVLFFQDHFRLSWQTDNSKKRWVRSGSVGVIATGRVKGYVFRRRF